MTELIRPALYQAFHKIENLTNQLCDCRADIRCSRANLRKQRLFWKKRFNYQNAVGET